MSGKENGQFSSLRKGGKGGRPGGKLGSVKGINLLIRKYRGSIRFFWVLGYLLSRLEKGRRRSLSGKKGGIRISGFWERACGEKRWSPRKGALEENEGSANEGGFPLKSLGGKRRCSGRGTREKLGEGKVKWGKRVLPRRNCGCLGGGLAREGKKLYHPPLKGGFERGGGRGGKNDLCRRGNLMGTY